MSEIWTMLFGFQTDFEKISENRTVIECLKSILVQISDVYCIWISDKKNLVNVNNLFDFIQDKTLFFFSAGRYEFGNKGVDVLIESLARLNHRMKAESPDKTVIFVFFPGPRTVMKPGIPPPKWYDQQID